MSPRVLVHCANLSITLDTVPLATNLSLSLAAGEIVCLVGGNGCGKTTLLEAIGSRSAGGKESENVSGPVITGHLHVSPGVRTHYLPQTVPAPAGTSFGGLSSHMQAAVLEVADDLGLRKPERMNSPLSLGEYQKLALAYALAADAELLLLDEPTNYLDIAGLSALEHHLEQQRRRGAGVFLVTHDRALTDACADETVLLTRERCYHVPGGATAVFGAREGDLQSRARQTAQIRRRIRALEEDVQRRSTWAYRKEQSKHGAGSQRAFIARRAAKMAKRAKAMERQADREKERLARTRPFVPKRVNLLLPTQTVRNRRVFLLDDVSFGFGGSSPLLHGVSFGATTRDRICLMGHNGSGKTTLLRLISGELAPLRGQVERNRSVPVVQVPQQVETFFPEPSLLANFSACPFPETEIRRALGAVQIRREKVHEHIGNFSRGELMRAALVRCLLGQAEFIILDEPTSHLDIESIPVLENVLGEYAGGFLIVSHDRAFVENVADTLYVIENGVVRLA